MFTSRLSFAALIIASAFAWPALCSPAVQARSDGAADSSAAGRTLDDLSAVGMLLDRARLMPVPEGAPLLERASAALKGLIEKGAARGNRSAAHFLSGEISFALGDYGRSAEAYGRSEKKAGGGPAAAAAAAARIMALEAAGRDGEAARAWKKWEKKYGDGPLLPEVLLAQAWNAVRRGRASEASVILESLKGRFPWMEKDRRVVLAGAALCYLDGRPSEALAALEAGGSGPGASYLKALSCEAEGLMLEAAAHYQDLAERYPRSALRDHAMLAKADIFLASGAYRSAAEEFARVAETALRPDVRAEAELRRAAAVYLGGDAESGAELLRGVEKAYSGSDVAARAQVLLGEVILSLGLHEEAIIEFNKVLTDYFEHELAAGAQYRVARCLDALGRRDEATSAYQTVVSGYPLAEEAPAAAYLAGAGLLERGRYLDAAPYFQLVIDRYAEDDGTGSIVFASVEHRELVEASLCLLELSYHRAGSLGQLSGALHLLLTRMPPSDSPWRAYALLIDADALAAQGRYADAQIVLERLIGEFPEHALGIPANRLLAWNYDRQGKHALAIKTEEGMVGRYASLGDAAGLGSAYLNKAHILFNRKEYGAAAAAYDEFLYRFPGHSGRLLALYQAGMSHYRLNHYGDAVDRWEEITASDPSAGISEKAWVRAGDLYFKAERYEDAKRCYGGLLENFSESGIAATGMLRLAQCEYNEGSDMEALELFSKVSEAFPASAAAGEAERGMEQALYRLGQREDGTEVLRDLVERYPASPFAADAQFEIAMRSYDGGMYSEAAEEFRRVVSQFPGYSAADRAQFLTADSYGRSGAQADARLAFEQFLLFFPESGLRTMARFRLGTIRFTEGDYMRAAVDFTGVLDEEVTADMASASLYNLALCRRMLGEADRAKELLEQYRKEHASGDERAADVAYQLGDIHEKAGRMKDALDEFERALAAGPGEAVKVELHYRRGLCLEQLGDADGAIGAYGKAIDSKAGDDDAFRLSALARCAALYEEKGRYEDAISAYREIVEHAADPELVVAAEERVSRLEAGAE